MNGTISPSTAPAPIQAAAFELNVRTITVFSICLSAPSRSLCFLGIGAITTSYSFLLRDQIQTLSRHGAQPHKSGFGHQISTPCSHSRTVNPHLVLQIDRAPNIVPWYHHQHLQVDHGSASYWHLCHSPVEEECSSARSAGEAV